MRRRLFFALLPLPFIARFFPVKNHYLEEVDPTYAARLFDRDDYFYSRIEKSNIQMIASRDMRVPLVLGPGVVIENIEVPEGY